MGTRRSAEQIGQGTFFVAIAFSTGFVAFSEQRQDLFRTELLEM